MKEIDMAPYEEQFTKLERLYYEQNAIMNLVAYMTDKNFTDIQYKRVLNDYIEASQRYENYIHKFELEVILPNCGQVKWTADFERRLIYVTSL